MNHTLNKTQNFYYKRAILGLRVYTPEQLSMITKEKKERIKRVHKKAQSVLQVLRYQKLVQTSNDTLNTFFSRGNIYTQLMSESVTFISPDLRVTLDDQQLGITKDDILSVLLESGVLGPNFLNLK
jgi:hypothetical protein